jgi:hypothetical protein
MANEFIHNLRDALRQVIPSLPGVNGTVTSADLDLGATPLNDDREIAIDVPSLSAADLPNGTTLTLTIQAGAAPGPNTSVGIVRQIVGTGGTINAQQFRARLPANTGRYYNLKIVAAGGTGDMSAKTLTLAYV